VRRSHRKALCRQPKRPERSSILAPTRHPEKRDGAEFGPFVELDRAIEGILGVTAMQGDAGPRLAARRRRFAGDQREVAAMARAGRRAPLEPVRDEGDA